MPIIDESGMRAALKQPQKTKVWLLFGEDGFLKQHYCDRLLSAFVPEGMEVFNLKIFQDDDAPLEDIFADADTLPMMAERRTVLVRNYPLNALGANQLKEFEKRLAGIPDTAVMIFYYNTLDVTVDPKKPGKWDPVVAAFAKYGLAVRLDHRTARQIAAALIKSAKNNPRRIRGEIDAETAEYLVERVGTDFLLLQNEFDKLCAFADGAPITREMIDLVCVESVEANIFDVSEAIFSGDTDKALAIGMELLHRKTPIQLIMGTLIRAYADAYRCKTAAMTRHSINDFAEAFGYRSTYALSRVTEKTRRLPLTAIVRSFDVLQKTDLESKSTNTASDVLLTQTLVSLAAIAKETQ